MKGLTFSYPWILALLPVLIIAGIIQYRKLPGRRMRAFLVLRFLGLMTLVAALSCPMILLPADRTAVIFLVDCSAGMGGSFREWAGDVIKKAAAKKKPDDRIGVVLFGSEPYLEKVPGEDGIGKWEVLPPGDGTDIASALTLAVSAFPDGFQKRVVLLSDGRETTGSAVSEATAAASMNIEIWCMPPPEDNFPEALVESRWRRPRHPRRKRSRSFCVSVFTARRIRKRLSR
ncbi:MAG: VWA domain-containing protein [Chloroflexi bacterium]|nr:VWA domain-containing protein [Chloroflexota bacterium]